MPQPAACLPITQWLIRERMQSRSEWNNNKLKAYRRCQSQKLVVEGEECCLDICLNGAFLSELQQGGQPANVAFTKLYLLYFEELRGCARQQGCKDEALTKDFVQQVLIDFYVKARMQAIELKRASLKTYLCRAVKYKWLDHLRKCGKQEPEGEPLLLLTPADDPPDKKIELLQELARKVFSNPASNCPELMSHYYFELWSYEEIIQSELGQGYSSVEALRNRVSQCRKEFESKLQTQDRLRKEYGELYGIYRTDLNKQVKWKGMIS